MSIIQKGVQYVEAEVALNEVRFALTTTDGEILATNSKHDKIRNFSKNTRCLNFSLRREASSCLSVGACAVNYVMYIKHKEECFI